MIKKLAKLAQFESSTKSRHSDSLLSNIFKRFYQWWHFCRTLRPPEQNKFRTAGQITERHLCAGHKFGGKDGCQGDSGGGLVSVDGDSEKYVLVGVMSSGIGCARKQLPGVYTRVEMFVEWVRDEVAKGTTGGRGSRSLGRTPRRTRDGSFRRERSYSRAYPERRRGRIVY